METKNINLNTPELVKYNEAVEFNAKRNNNFMFNNEGNEMALIVFRSIFRNANNNIKVVARNLNNIVTNHKEYISALESFLIKSNSKLELLLSEFDKTNKCDLFEMLKQYKEKVTIKVIKDGRTFKDDKGRIIHFCIADEHMYRLEYNTEKRMAECNFNDIKECQILDKLFCSVYNNNVWSDNESLA